MSKASAPEPHRAASSRRTLGGGVALLILPVALAAACGGDALTARGPASDGLVFAHGPDEESLDLYRARLADGAVRRLLTSPESVESWPYWSPTGRRLVFQTRPRGQRINDLQLWSLGDPTPTALTETPDRDERWPGWSPDGTRLVYAFRDDPPGAGLGWTSGPGVGGIQATTGPKDFFFRPDYARDGLRLVAQRRNENGRGSRLWWLDADGTAARLTHERGWIEQKPFFDRTGAWVVYTRGRPEHPREIARVAFPGGPERTLPPSDPGADDHSARPSPARDEIAFVSDRTGNRDVFLWSESDGALRNLTNSTAHDELAPRWSPDGDRLVLTRTTPRKAGLDGERLPRAGLELVVVDRQGRILLETPGLMADWMPPF